MGGRTAGTQQSRRQACAVVQSAVGAAYWKGEEERNILEGGRRIQHLALARMRWIGEYVYIVCLIGVESYYST